MIECLGWYNLINYQSRKNEGLIHLYAMNKGYIGLRINSLSLVIFNKYLNKSHKRSRSDEAPISIIPLNKIMGCIAFPFTCTYDHNSFINSSIDEIINLILVKYENNISINNELKYCSLEFVIILLMVIFFSNSINIELEK